MKSSTETGAELMPEIVPVRLPFSQRVFGARSARFRSLAPGHAIGDYLSALSQLADAQTAALTRVRFDLDGKSLQNEFPLHAGRWRRDEAWRRALSVILSDIQQAPLPSLSRDALRRLSASPPEALEMSADAILAGDFAATDLASAPFVGAALQAYWTALAGMVAAESIAHSRQVCPVCASPPVAGIVLGDRKLRYLVCGLCAAEWYMPRLTCSSCGSTAGVSYMKIERDTSGAKAESCAQCRTYLKLFYLESAPSVEPFADDVATLALDFLMSGEGFSRSAPNLFLLPGS
jgi:FdhE protein